jgi:hypothetical protein
MSAGQTQFFSSGAEAKSLPKSRVGKGKATRQQSWNAAFKFPSCLWRDSCPDMGRGLDEHEKSRSSGSEVGLLIPPYRDCSQWLRGTFVTRYSGATAWDLHPFPYSPLAVTRGTPSCFHHNLWWYCQRTTPLIGHLSKCVKTNSPLILT